MQGEGERIYTHTAEYKRQTPQICLQDMKMLNNR